MVMIKDVMRKVPYPNLILGLKAVNPTVTPIQEPQIIVRIVMNTQDHQTIVNLNTLVLKNIVVMMTPNTQDHLAILMTTNPQIIQANLTTLIVMNILDQVNTIVNILDQANMIVNPLNQKVLKKDKEAQDIKLVQKALANGKVKRKTGNNTKKEIGNKINKDLTHLNLKMNSQELYSKP